jgi:enamine deaminase RidA (YjgF/YER057c/UK114 family)
MKRINIDLARSSARGMTQLSGTAIPAVFTDAVRVELSECTLLYIGGKLGTLPDGRLAGPTFAAQTMRCLERIRDIVASEGGTMDDVVRVRVFVHRYDEQSIRDIHEARAKFWTRPDRYPASTLVVAPLVIDGALVEIDADAVIPARAG